MTTWYASNYYTNCPALERITYPASLSDTANTPFAASIKGCASLKKVVFKSTASSLPSFGNCVSLEEITLPHTIGKISTELFTGCTNLRRVNGFHNLNISKLPQGNFFRLCIIAVGFTSGKLNQFCKQNVCGRGHKKYYHTCRRNRSRALHV